MDKTHTQSSQHQIMKLKIIILHFPKRVFMNMNSEEEEGGKQPTN